MTPAPADSAVEELPDGLLRAGYRHRAAPDLSRAVDGTIRWGLALITFAEASPPRRKISEFSTRRSAMAGGNGGVVEDVAPVRKTLCWS